MLGILRSIAAITAAAGRKPVTVQYPTEMRRLPPRSRGLPLLVWDQGNDEPVCIGCQQCANVCPVACITVAGPVENPHFRPKDHDEAACRAQNDGVCIHNSTRRTLPAISMEDSMRFMIDEDRCMRCGMCEEVCPTDQERYGSQKAIVLGTGHLSIQSSVYDRRDNVLDLEGLTYHSRALGLELNAVMGSKPPKENLDVQSDAVAGIRLNAALTDVINPPVLSLSQRIRLRLLKMYAPFWSARRGLSRGRKADWPALSEMASRNNRRR